MTMETDGSQVETPRAVADKSRKASLLAAIRMALAVESAAVRHNTQTFNRGRYAAVSRLPDYDALKDRARQVKEDAIARSDELVAQLERVVHGRGGHFYLAATAADARRYITDVCRRASACCVVKGKSMTSEEVGLNPVLEAAGIEVVETDLAEFILQAADEQPSHVIAPAIHYSRERITALFRRVFKADLPLDSGEDLTRFARERLREKFLAADVGITGANFIVADSGTLVLVESEANIRMSSLLPPIHIAIAGIEKVVATRADLAPFIELLAASATGQGMSSYTSVITPPLRVPVLADNGSRREFHLVLVDNGRSRMRRDPVLHEALYCIRCSACLNSCANFQTVGGHAFGGETYSGGIGGVWEAATRSLEQARFSELCTGCTRCVNQCPVRIDVPWLNTVLHQRLNSVDTPPWVSLRDEIASVPAEDAGASLSKLFFGRFDVVGKWGSRMAALANRLSRLNVARAAMETLFNVDRRRSLPAFAAQTLVDAARRHNIRPPSAPIARAVLVADIFTNFNSPERGLAALDIFAAAGVDVVVSDVLPDGRAALSQGLVATARRQAEHAAQVLRAYIKDGREVVVVEPSVLSMMRLDYRHLLRATDFELLRDHCFDPVEYLASSLRRAGRTPSQLFTATRSPKGMRVFYHSHCQQRTVDAAAPTVDLLRAVGFDVITSTVECCGMAGSFGYKKDFYELSLAVGEDLVRQVAAAEAGGPRLLVASGTSCQEQLQGMLGRAVVHPLQLLRTTLA